jgi:hypothetical protein
MEEEEKRKFIEDEKLDLNKKLKSAQIQIEVILQYYLKFIMYLEIPRRNNMFNLYGEANLLHVSALQSFCQLW